MSATPLFTSPSPSQSEKINGHFELLARLLVSVQLKRSARLCDFLRYIWQRSLQEDCDQIHEQEIGTQVFGRLDGYDTTADNIVRVSATDLRKRIKNYFEQDGAQEPFIVEIPRGSYKIAFHQRPLPPEVASAAVEEKLSPVHAENNAETRGIRASWLVCGLLIIALTTCCIYLWVQNHALRQSLYAWQTMPAMRSLWSDIFATRQETDVVLADPTLALVEDITHEQIPLNTYLSNNYLNSLHDSALSLERQKDIEMVTSRGFGSLGDFHVAQRLAALDPTAKRIILFSARDYRAQKLKDDNVILIGSKKSNPWVNLFEGNMNFTLAYDQNRAATEVHNRAPMAGEQAVYIPPAGAEPASGYAIIAYLPNPEQKGRVILIEGTVSEATAAAGDFLTSEERLSGLQELFHVKRLPYFEILLKTTHVNGTPLDANVIAYRISSEPKR
jgi:hypothetical protein